MSREPFVVPGFVVGAGASGIRYKNRPDLAVIAAQGDAVGAGVFTTNQFCAAPVHLCRDHLQSPATIRAVCVNAGIANACSGAEGLHRASQMARITAESLGVPARSVLVASTGVIGPQIPMKPIAQVMPGLTQSLRADAWDSVARAIMTTDTVSKLASTQFQLGGKTVTIGGVAKGAGMIAPNMATLLVFVCTDTVIEPGVLQHWVRDGADYSFNAITVDGDTSTNDTLLVLASGCAGNAAITDADSPSGKLFGSMLRAVLLDLAVQVVYDGEGATKFIEVAVTGAPDVESARTIAFTIANSPLVKTAFFGQDANWGRIVCAAGRAGVPLLPERVALFFDSVCVFRNGTPVQEEDTEAKASRAFQQKEISVRLDLGLGTAQFSAYTCDFSYDYVKINADYRS